jgi:hypothetical protein
LYFNLIPLSVLTLDRQQITEWFKKVRRKRPVPTSQSKVILDPTGKSSRKPVPLQPYQAYSARYFQPEDSPLRGEVEDLWQRREEQEVVDMLSPFMVGEASRDRRLFFHNTVMRWKYSKLSEGEKKDLQGWIDKEVEERWDTIKYPWKGPQVEKAGELTAENQYIQKYVFIPYSEFPV